MDGEINKVWEEVTGTIQIIVKEVLEISRGRVVDKDILWLNKEVQEVIARKKF